MIYEIELRCSYCGETTKEQVSTLKDLIGQWICDKCEIFLFKLTKVKK